MAECPGVRPWRGKILVVEDSEHRLDGALLDVRLHNVLCFPIAVILKAHKILFIFMTGYRDPSVFPVEFRAAPVVCKPFGNEELRTALGSIFNRRDGNRISLEVTARLSPSIGFTQQLERPITSSSSIDKTHIRPAEPDQSARGE